MIAEGSSSDRRKHERIDVEFPLTYKIGRKTLMGNALNVCNEGIFVESFLSSRAALDLFRILKRKPHHRMDVEFTYEGNRDLRDVQIKHFHLDFSGREAYRFTVGFWLPKEKQE